MWNMQHNNEIEGVDRQELMLLVERCQIHLANATATNSPSRRYSIILEELRNEATSQRPIDGRVIGSNTQGNTASFGDAPVVDVAALPISETFNASDISQAGYPNGTSGDGCDLFMDWQTSDWLELDASVGSDTRISYHGL